MHLAIFSTTFDRTFTMNEPQNLERAITRLNERAWGVSLGLLFGAGLLMATLILVVKGGPDAGQHLALLHVYFPGYSVTPLGALIGFVYGFVLGYAIGRFVGGLYNQLTG